MSYTNSNMNLYQDPQNPGVWIHMIPKENYIIKSPFGDSTNNEPKVVSNKQTSRLGTDGTKKINRCALCTKPCESGNICAKCM